MKTKDIVLIALFAALTAALGLFPLFMVPVLAVPVTAQSMGPMLAGSVLGARRGALALLLFLLLVAVGLPLLSGGRGGYGILIGPGAGFLWCWPVAAWLIGWLFERFWTRLNYATAGLIIALGGIVVVYAGGVAWLGLVIGKPFAPSLLAMGAFVPGDLLKVVVATLVAMTVRRSYPLIVAPAAR